MDAPVQMDTTRAPRSRAAAAADAKAAWSLSGMTPKPPVERTGPTLICGMTTNGLVGTHFIPAAHDHGMPETTAAGLLALIGVFDIAGTITSGWLTDRVDSRLRRRRPAKIVTTSEELWPPAARMTTTSGKL